MYRLTNWSDYTVEDFQQDLPISLNEQNLMVILTKKEAQEQLDKKLLDYLHLLNEANQEKVIKYASDLSKIPEYRSNKEW